jgi:TetR/AcrR family transcriptional repressor of nem operon
MMNRKQEILEKASDLLQTRSYSSFSYKDLSEALGITKASIHHHFESKEVLGIALADMYWEMAHKNLADIDSRSKTNKAKLDTFLKQSREMAASGRKICPLGSIGAEQNVVPASVSEKMNSLCQSMMKWMSGVLKAGRKEGEFHFEGKPEDQAKLIMASVRGGLQLSRSHGVDYFDAITKQLKQGMKA